jgi:RNA polymerase sigma-70 factor (ECF subfamily)
MVALEFNNHLNRLSNILLTFAYNLTKNSDDAQDLYQETAYRALTNQDKFRDGTNFKAWIFTIMKNIFINDYRKKAKSNVIVDETDNLYYINLGGTIGNLAESGMMMEELEFMVESIDSSIRIPFVMHYQGFKYQEIADHLELPLGTVKSRIFFARKELKELIAQRYNIVAYEES